ncbi:MAG TPA: thioredoxin family protein, partial [Spirochaetia bacterium]|nr:thioredoxin family protein [Spirochaetia bacterium]
PFLLVGFFPGLVYRIPKPGPWMSLVKEVMGFALLLTDLWLFSVIGGQTGVQGVLRSLGFLLSLGAAGWVWGRFGNPTAERKKRIRAGIAVVIITVVGGFAAFNDFSSVYAQSTMQGESAQLPEGFLPFSQAALSEAQAAGKPVFVAFSARWCLTCMTNEKTVLSRKDVKAAFRNNGVLLLYADYTNPNDQIASWLSHFGRAGVPLYLYYRPGKDEPEFLPEVLTSGTILSLFERH